MDSEHKGFCFLMIAAMLFMLASMWMHGLEGRQAIAAGLVQKVDVASGKVIWVKP